MIENLYPVRFIEDKAIFGFLLGVTYSIIGIGIAIILFPEDPAIVAVALISLMFYPTLKKLLRREEAEETLNTRFSIVDFFHDHKYVFQVYVLFFLGSLLVFAFFATALPSLATNHIFENQINLLYGGSTGAAIFTEGLFGKIFFNNLGVLILVFITAFFLGEGGIFLLTWNASVWGTIFGTFAKNFASGASQSPFLAFLLVLAIVLTHTLLEAFAYISSANAGSILSRAVVIERIRSIVFGRVFKGAIITLGFALLVLVVAVAVETYVLSNITVYQNIVQYSFR